MADGGEIVSLAFQFVASFSWAIGAGMAGPETAADYLQFIAALAWCVANFAGAWSMGLCSLSRGDKKGAGGTTTSVTSSMRGLLSSSSGDFGKANGATDGGAKEKEMQANGV